MNIPLINTNDKESINTSLIAIKRATEELNNLIKIADEKMAQLDEKAKKYTDDKINALDVASVGGSGKYISAIEETDGKISATASDLATTVTPSSTQPVTSGGVDGAILGNTVYNSCYNDGYTTFNIDTVGAGHRTYIRIAIGGGTSGNCPSDYGVVYTLTANGTAWKFQIAKETFTDTTYTRMNINDNGWTTWQKLETGANITYLIPLRLSSMRTSFAQWERYLWLGVGFLDKYTSYPEISGKTKKVRLIINVQTASNNLIIFGAKRQSDVSVIELFRQNVWGGVDDSAFSRQIQVTIDPSFLLPYTEFYFMSDVASVEVAICYLFAEVYYE